MYRVESSIPIVSKGFLKNERPIWSFVRRFESYPDAVKYVNETYNANKYGPERKASTASSCHPRMRIVAERNEEYSILDN